jgi:hypothetical protein
MSKGLKINFLATLVLMVNISGFSQVTITGPTCVIPGVIYQYKIQGKWAATSNMQLCISNGTIADSNSTNSCTPQSGAPLATVLVIWNRGSNGSLQLKSTVGGVSLSVNITSVLFPGNIDTTILRQTIGTHSIPSLIKCSAATGGSCSPVYEYQWQQSIDMVNWTDIKGSTAQNLNFTSLISQSSFFRRKTTESTSSSIAYSNSAMVDVLIILPQTDSTGKATGSSSYINEDLKNSKNRNLYSDHDSNLEIQFTYSSGYIGRTATRINFSAKKLTASNVLYV